METVCVKRRIGSFLGKPTGSGGFENWRSKEGKEGRKSARLESIFRVCLDWGEHGGINDLMGHHHERRAESRDVMATDMAALSLFNRGRDAAMLQRLSVMQRAMLGSGRLPPGKEEAGQIEY